MNKKVVLVIFGIGGVSAIVYSIVNKRIDKKKEGRSYEFQRILTNKLEPENNINDPLFDTSKVDKTDLRLNSDEHDSIAKNIWDSWAWYGDDEEKVYSQLRLIKTDDDYKEVAKRYMIKSEGVALDIDMKDRLSNSEYKKVSRIIDSYEK